MEALFFSFGIIAAIALLPLLLKYLLGFRKTPTRTDQSAYAQTEIVCRHNSYGYCFILLICTFFSVLFLIAGVYLLSEQNSAGFMFIILDILFIVLAVMTFLWTINRVIVIYQDGIIFRDCFGKVYCYSIAQIQDIQYIRIYGRNRQRQIKLQMPDRKISFNSYCTNFSRAWDFYHQTKRS